MNIYIIEARDSQGDLILGDYPQPESFFGMKAIHGISNWDMSRKLFAHLGDKISLRGDDIPNWPRLVNPNWVARVKTW
jgi:hypothetical protein